MGPKDHMQREVLFDAFSLLPMGGEKNLEGMGEAAAHRAKRLHIREDNIMPVVICEWVDPLSSLCGSMVYL